MVTYFLRQRKKLDMAPLLMVTAAVAIFYQIIFFWKALEFQTVFFGFLMKTNFYRFQAGRFTLALKIQLKSANNHRLRRITESLRLPWSFLLSQCFVCWRKKQNTVKKQMNSAANEERRNWIYLVKNLLKKDKLENGKYFKTST